MTAGATDADMRTGQRKGCVVVIECGRRPGGRAVANIALLRKSGARVIRIGGVLKIRQVTGDTRRAGQPVIAACVTLAALQRGVSSGQGPARRGVIKDRVHPGRGVMA